MFQFRRFPTYTYLIQCTLHGYCPCGLPHSEIPGSMDICSSPRLIAACHVLHRLLMPRHSPCALSSLTYHRLRDVSEKSLVLSRIMQASQIEIVIVTLIFSDVVPQLNITCHTSSEAWRLSVALLHFHHIVQFSRCSLQLRLKSDRNI